MFADFLKHLFPKVILKNNLRISYTYCLGGVAALVYIILFVTGILLLFFYEPSPDKAYNSIIFIEEHIFLGKYLRNMHRLCNHIFLILIFLHILRVIFTGAYRFRSYNWIIGMILLILSIFEAYTGYLLPMDQLSLWATQTGMELIGKLPYGHIIKDLLVVDAVTGDLTLLRFYTLHIIVVPFVLIILMIIHFYRIRKDRGVLPYI
jgi:quinol-cytochrome oxidoreductase complex cytochrome b subunit